LFKKEREISNLKNIGCKDLRIVQMEVSKTENWNEIYDDKPLWMAKSYSTNKDIKTHSYDTGKVIRSICPNAKIFLLPSTKEGFEWCGENNIDVISVSLSGTFSDDLTELKLEDKIFNLISSGNYGLESLLEEKRKKHWTSIGAVHLINNKIVRPSYSSTGKELDFVSFSNLDLHDDSNFSQGTSFSCPFAAGLIGQYIQIHFDYFGYKPTPKKINQFLLNNTIDLEKIGFDNETGNGLITLPKEYKPFAHGLMKEWDEYVIKYIPEGFSKFEHNDEVLKRQLDKFMLDNNIRQLRT